MAHRQVINFVLFQIGWLGCVLAGAYQLNWLALLVTILFVAIHFRFSHCPKSDSKLVIVGVLTGLILDSLWSATGLMAYASQQWPPLAPIWVLCLWCVFVLTLNHSLSWLRERAWLAAICAFVASPLSYLAGQKLGAVTWLMPIPMALAAAFSWAVVLPLLFKLARDWQQKEVEAANVVA
ncbi:Hypothetical protein Q7C_334 [Methylophaga frappieri]|uniref:DUF2878 domain-containing protein n=1 Tax=Methylophaga frappieri (strain ATCC BAA-2434 / DSM 25690 / JAM7) TaxID=754477 RepID=I1YF19_METFJ|nr:DUF2878 domain-containing protein [Methylophaga frappieri]AFJ01512.1 Hypothetical protein Q7C_334 [Methylophaga frappieri]